MATEDAKRHIADAKTYLQEFQEQGSELQKCWSEESWHRINNVIRNFCVATQGINMSVGGLHRATFDESTQLIATFVRYSEDLLADAGKNNCLPPDDVLNHILGVIERCGMRVRELTEKRDDIEIYNRKIEEIADP